MHEIVLSIVCIATLVGVWGYIFFSKPKVEKPSAIFNADISWGGPEEKEVFKNYKKATFKGEHKHY